MCRYEVTTIHRHHTVPFCIRSGGAAQAELVGGTRCNPACTNQFGVFGEVALLWFEIWLRDDLSQCANLFNLLEFGAEDWNTIYRSNFVCFGP